MMEPRGSMTSGNASVLVGKWAFEFHHGLDAYRVEYRFDACGSGFESILVNDSTDPIEGLEFSWIADGGNLRMIYLDDEEESSVSIRFEVLGDVCVLHGRDGSADAIVLKRMGPFRCDDGDYLTASA